MSNQPSSSKNQSKRQNTTRDRDKSKAVIAVESGGSSQCDTPPLNDKDALGTQGKYAGVSPESVQCMAEQVAADINSDAANNLAEDTSYRLRQVINTIALHSELLKKTRVDSSDVNAVLRLMDTSPIVGSHASTYLSFGEEKLCCQNENIVNVMESAMTSQNYVYASVPTISVEWITDEKSLANNHNISLSLQNYYTKVARAILNLKKKVKDVAVDDLMTNTRIGPIFPNLFNLAVLVLNDDNLNALNVPAKKPLQRNVLDMVDALCSNPCSLDTNIQQQRLFPVMVSNILGNGSLAEKMVAILTKITRTWPSFISIGKGILFEYLSQGTKERLTAPMIKCVMALGRQALVECLADHLDYIDDSMHAPRKHHKHTELRETILDASTCLLRSENTTYLEDYVITDYTLYEMLGDSIMPRRLLFPVLESQGDDGCSNNERSSEDELSSMPVRTVTYRPRIRIVDTVRRTTNSVRRDAVFEPVKFNPDKLKCRVKIKVPGCRSLPIKIDRVTVAKTKRDSLVYRPNRTNPVVAASGMLNRFRYRLNKSTEFPIFGIYTL